MSSSSSAEADLTDGTKASKPSLASPLTASTIHSSSPIESTATFDGEVDERNATSEPGASFPSSKATISVTPASSSIQHSNVAPTETIAQDERPLPNGQLLPQSLLDETPSNKSHGNQITGSNSTEMPGDRYDSLAQVSGAQYPSPSSGFVPPVTQDDFTLGSVAASLSDKAKTSKMIDTSSSKLQTSEQHGGDSQIDESQAQGLSSISLRRQSDLLKESENSRLSIPTPHSDLSSSPDDGHSQAISARSSPSTVAPKRRRSSASPTPGSGVGPSEADRLHYQLAPLRIRDYAFSEVDPRHVGARDVSAPSPRRSLQVMGEEADEDDAAFGISSRTSTLEDDGDVDDDDDASFHAQGLPMGLYHAAYEFEAESEHELSVQVGQRLRLIGHVDGGWAIVVRIPAGQEDVAWREGEEPLDAEKGLVPEAYLEYLG